MFAPTSGAVPVRTYPTTFGRLADAVDRLNIRPQHTLQRQPRKDSPVELILIILVVLLLFGGGGFYGYRSGYYGQRGFGGILGLIVLLLILFLLFGRGYHGLY